LEQRRSRSGADLEQSENLRKNGAKAELRKAGFTKKRTFGTELIRLRRKNCSKKSKKRKKIEKIFGNLV